MSRILRRPMFRGGKVIDSRGTGITSGLMDGGRVGFRFGGRGAGPTFNPFAASQIAPGQLGGQISRAAAPAPDYSFLDTINISEFFEPAGIKGEGFKPRVNPGKVMKSKEELALMWIIVGLVVIPLVIFYPPILLFGLFLYASVKLYNHYNYK